jgi:hypothetical protein
MEDARITRCLAAKRESRTVEFKSEFLPTDAGQAIELLKDIVAIANSGGGALAVGIGNDGEPSRADVEPVLRHDHAKYCDLIRKYTLQNYCDFEVVEAVKDGCVVAIFLINAPDYPLVFEKPGTYPIDNNRKQVTVFGQGTVFFRHGAKSEHGTGDDLRRFMQQRMREVHDQLLKGLRKVVEAPRTARLEVAPQLSLGKSEGSATQVFVRMTDNPDAPGVVGIDRGRLCPYRQKDVIAKLKERLPEGPLPTTHDLRAINKVYNLPAREDFCWEPEYSSRQYSEAYIDWVFGKIKADPDFLSTARSGLYEITHP